MKEFFLKVYKKTFGLLSGHKIGLLFPARQINEFIVSKIRKDFTVIDRHQMFLDPTDSLYLSTYGVYEKAETEIIKKEIKKGNIVLDIGANIGYFTLLFARQVGKSGKVFAFEPDPKNFALLKKNIEANGYKNVVLEQKAVSNKNGKLVLHQSESNSAIHSIYNTEKFNKSTEILAVSIDKYFKKRRKRVDFIKMDIQGSEFQAFKGMEKTVNKNKNLKIITEYSPRMLKASGIKPQEYLAQIIKQGFNIYKINEKTGFELTLVSELLKKYSHEELEKMSRDSKKSTNLFCKRPTAQAVKESDRTK